MTARLLLGALACWMGGCAFEPAPGRPAPSVLRLATTTSTYDSGLLDAILPEFEAAHQARVDVLAVGTGQAFTLGRNGDVDVILVHSRAQEEQFVAQGYGTRRYDVMYNDFVLAGPEHDPADIAGLTRAAAALSGIAARGAPFASRGDGSGTHSKELSLWQLAGIDPSAGPNWYDSLGQGMGETLQFAQQTGAYLLTDRGTFLAQRESLPGLTILFGGRSIEQNPDPDLLNPYSVIPINPASRAGIASDLSQRFVEWLTSVETQRAIAEYGVAAYDQPLFYPSSAAYREADP